MRTIQSILIATGVALITVVFGVTAMLASPFNPSGHLVHWFARWWSRTLLWMARIPVSVSGLEHIPEGRACVLVSNHASAADIPALFGFLPFQFRVIAKESLFRIPILGWCMRLAGYISIDRSNPRKAVKSLQKAAKRLNAGLPVLVFPEGTRSRNGALQPFNPGAFLLAIEAGAPVIPVGINGSFDILIRGSLRVRPGRPVHIRIGPPLDTTGYRNRDRARLSQEAHEAVAGLLGEGASDVETTDTEKRISS